MKEEKKDRDEGTSQRSERQNRRKLRETKGGECFKEKEAFHSGISGAAKRLKTALSSEQLISTHMKTDFAGRERTEAS